MLAKIKKYISLSIAALFLSLSLSGAAFAQADIQSSTCRGAEELKFGGTVRCEQLQASERDVNDLIATVINIFSVIVGIIAVIMIVYGGFRYITSGGDTQKVTSARNTILYAIVGLIIVALAQFIVRFVLAKATST